MSLEFLGELNIDGIKCTDFKINLIEYILKYNEKSKNYARIVEQKKFILGKFLPLKTPLKKTVIGDVSFLWSFQYLVSLESPSRCEVDDYFRSGHASAMSIVYTIILYVYV